jgi:hypothetical protein
MNVLFLYSPNVLGYGNNSVLLTKGENLLGQIIVYTYVSSRGVCAEERARE